MRWPVRWDGGGMRGKRWDLVPMGSCVQRGTYLRVRDSMCVTVHAPLLPQHPQWPPPRPPHTPAAPSGGGRSLSGSWCCRSFRLSNQSDLPRLPTPRPYPLHPLHRKWAGPGVLVSACSAVSRLLPGPREPEPGPGEMAAVPAAERSRESASQLHVPSR